MYQWCWRSTQYTNECRLWRSVCYQVCCDAQWVLRNWIIVLHKKSFWIVPVPLVLHCGLTPLIWGIFKGRSIDSEMHWGYQAVQSNVNRLYLREGKRFVQSLFCILHILPRSYLSPYWKIGLIYFYPSLATLGHCKKNGSIGVSQGEFLVNCAPGGAEQSLQVSRVSHHRNKPKWAMRLTI